MIARWGSSLGSHTWCWLRLIPVSEIPRSQDHLPTSLTLPLQLFPPGTMWAVPLNLPIWERSPSLNPSDPLLPFSGILGGHSLASSCPRRGRETEKGKSLHALVLGAPEQLYALNPRSLKVTAKCLLEAAISGFLLQLLDGERIIMPHPLVTPSEASHQDFERRGLTLVSWEWLCLEPKKDSPYPQVQTTHSLKPSLPFSTSIYTSLAISSTWNALFSTHHSFIYSFTKNPLSSFICTAFIK